MIVIIIKVVVTSVIAIVHVFVTNVLLLVLVSFSFYLVSSFATKFFGSKHLPRHLLLVMPLAMAFQSHPAFSGVERPHSGQSALHLV